VNEAAVHAEDDEGYKFSAATRTIAEVDKINHQISYRMVTSWIQWRNYGQKRANLMKRGGGAQEAL